MQAKTIWLTREQLHAKPAGSFFALFAARWGGDLPAAVGQVEDLPDFEADRLFSIARGFRRDQRTNPRNP